MSRTRAFGGHLALSATIVGVACALIFLVWYPAPYFEAVGTWSVLRVLVGVDLVLGPLLTLIVFKPGKRGLALDLAVIAVIQLAALTYGLTVIYRERPYYTVFALDRFHVLAYRDIVPEQRDDPALVGPEKLGERPAIGPQLVVANLPTDREARQRLLEETVFEGQPDIERRPEFWTRYDGQLDQIRRVARPVAALEAAQPGTAARLAAFAAKHGVRLERVGFVPITARNRDLAFLLDLSTGTPLGVLDVDPWVDAPPPE
jgi:hypothetical protein